MNIDNKLERLKNIAEIEAPEFLLTRIKQRINNLAAETAPVQWKWAFAMMGAIVITINAIAIYNNTNKNDSSMQTVATMMQLNTTNELYHE